MAHRSLLKYIDSREIDLRQLDLSKTASMPCHSCGDTHKGWVRIINEDAYLELPDAKLWAVADGMGGHKRGDYASKAVVKALRGFSNQGSLINIVEDLQHRLLEANNTCQHAFRARRVGSTVALLFEHRGYCFFLWAGDSRIYRLRNDKLEPMTHDHSLAQEKFETGELNQDEAATHPSAHILTRAIGVHRNLKLELNCCPVEPGDRYLLCSDGLYGEIDAEQIHSQLSNDKPREALNGLMASALANSGRDNITAIIVDFEP